jgi:hypothetical protein
MEGEHPEVSDGGKVVRARKNWRCCDCQIPIPKKTRYWAMSGMWSGEWGTYRMCLTCREFRDSFSRKEGMADLAFGFLHEFITEYLEEDHPQVHLWLVRSEAIDTYQHTIRNKGRR